MFVTVSVYSADKTKISFHIISLYGLSYYVRLFNVETIRETDVFFNLILLTAFDKLISSDINFSNGNIL